MIKRKETTAAKLIEYMKDIKIIDTHEHLSNESERLKEIVDFSKIFSDYTECDLISAGMRKPDYADFKGCGLDVETKWKIFGPYYEKIKNGSYARAARISAGKFYGIDDLRCLEDAVALTGKIQQANKPGLYRKVLNEACNIKIVVNFDPGGNDREFFRQVEFMTQFTDISFLNDLDRLTKDWSIRPVTLTRYIDGIYAYIDKLIENGIKGLKFHTAYFRDLLFENVTMSDAERIYNRIFSESFGMRAHALGFNETRPLQDFLVHKIVEYAGETGLPIFFHTGIHHTGYRERGNDLSNSNPSALWSLINRYDKTKFVLLHAGIPWMKEAGIMAKYFNNVFIDMAWDHIISPELSVEALKTWIDMVPRNKIFGFGGDYSVVEKVYGHLQLAEENIARALAAKVDDGSITEKDSYAWIDDLLYNNPYEFYQLNI